MNRKGWMLPVSKADKAANGTMTWHRKVMVIKGRQPSLVQYTSRKIYSDSISWAPFAVPLLVMKLTHAEHA